MDLSFMEDPDFDAGVEIQRELYVKSLIHFGRDAFEAVNGPGYKHGKHFDVLCRHLEAVAKKDDPVGRITRLLVNMPPAVGKSYYTSVVYAPWVWSFWPSCRLLYFSYAIPRAIKDSTQARMIIRSNWYRKHFGDTLQIEKGEDQKLFYRTTAGGWRMTSYPGGPALGEHPDLIIIDDPISKDQVRNFEVKEAQRVWYFEDLATRGMTRDVAHIVSHQRLDVDDLSGHIERFSKELIVEDGYSPWQQVMLPMEYEPDRAMPDVGYGGEWRTEPGELIAPEMAPPDVVKSVKRSMTQKNGTWSVAAEFQQRPSRRNGAFFKMSRIQEIPRSMFPKKFVQIVRFWDLAGTTEEDGGKCWTAGPLVGRVGDDPIESRFYLLDMVREQKDGGDVEDLIRASCQADWLAWRSENDEGRQVLESYFEREPNSNSKRYAQILEQMFAKFSLRAVQPGKDKETRAYPLQSIIREGRFYVPSDAPWKGSFMAEGETFPSGTKDQIDGVAAAILEMIEPTYKRMTKATAAADRSAQTVSNLGKYGQEGKCLNETCTRPAFGGDGYCCKCCHPDSTANFGSHVPECSGRWNDWYIKNSR